VFVAELGGRTGCGADRALNVVRAHLPLCVIGLSCDVPGEPAAGSGPGEIGQWR
jgi:hypothetical protein